MDHEATPQLSARTGSIIHVALIGAILSTVIVLGSVRSLISFALLDEAELLIRLIGGVVLVASLVLVRLVRSGVIPRQQGQDRNSWWAANGGRVLVIWALADAVAMCGTVFWFLTGDPVLLALTVFGSLLLMLNRPGRLMTNDD